MRVTQLINNRGNAAANQFVIEDKGVRKFQSYETIIAEIKNGVVTLDDNALNYSQTTSKHLFIFLGMKRKEIEQRIKNGQIKERDLN